MHKFSKRSKEGSSALNILIALVAIVVLAAVLFPMFVPHGQPPRKLLCQSNLKEMAIAIQIYWNDYDTKLPSSMLVSHSKKWNKSDFSQFATNVGRSSVTHNPKTYVEALRPYIKSEDIWFCPSDSAKDNIDQNTKTSYFWKTAIDKAWYGEGCKKPCRKEADFGYTSDQVILYERADFHNGGEPPTNGAMINVAYLDSHVKRITITNATSGDPKNPAAADDGEPMYFNYNFEQDKGLSSDSVPAKFVDPRVYADNF